MAREHEFGSLAEFYEVFDQMSSPGLLITQAGVQEPIGVIHYHEQSDTVLFGEGIAVRHVDRGRGVAQVALKLFMGHAKDRQYEQLQFRAQQRVVGYYINKFGAQVLSDGRYPLMVIPL